MAQERTEQSGSMKKTGKGGSVADIMTPHPECVTENETIQRVAQMMVDCDCGAMPVVDSEDSRKVIGMITDRDIVVRVIAKGTDVGTARVRDAMTRQAHTVKSDEPISSVHTLMSEQQIRRVPVVDQNEQIVGIIALADVATGTSDDRKLGDTVEDISS